MIIQFWILKKKVLAETPFIRTLHGHDQRQTDVL